MELTLMLCDGNFMAKMIRKFMAFGMFLTLLLPSAAFAAEGHVMGLSFLGIRVEFVLFGLVLLGIALFHHRTFSIAVAGLIAIGVFKLCCTSFDIPAHLHRELKGLLNLFGLLMGFAILARHFEESRAPEALPRWLPSGWLGGFVLLWMVFVLSSFLDNIAAAMIGGTIAMVVFKRNVHIGYFAAIVAASNAGGAGSVVGDTTTTMLWIGGANAFDVFRAYAGAVIALAVCGTVAARQQDKLQPLTSAGDTRVAVDWGRLLIVALMLVGAIIANILTRFPSAGLWLAIFVGAMFRKTAWRELVGAAKGSLFFVALVLCSSMMPVDALPAPTWQTTFGMGFVSAFAGTIPFTKLALVQGGYDWGFVAYAVGFGGSIIWFGSSAGVALANIFPQCRSVRSWLRDGWHVPLAYVIGFGVMLLVMGWHPHALR